MRKSLAGIGFSAADAMLFPQHWRLKSAEQLVDAVRDGTVRTRAVLAAQTPEIIAKITAYVDAGLAEVASGDASYNVPMPAIIGSGSKPMG